MPPPLCLCAFRCKHRSLSFIYRIGRDDNRYQKISGASASLAALALTGNGKRLSVVDSGRNADLDRPLSFLTKPRPRQVSHGGLNDLSASSAHVARSDGREKSAHGASDLACARGRSGRSPRSFRPLRPSRDRTNRSRFYRPRPFSCIRTPPR